MCIRDRLNVTGTLTVNSELLLGQGTIDGVAWTEGSYDLISAGTVTGAPAPVICPTQEPVPSPLPS